MGTNFNEETWANEVVGEAEMLVRFGGINPADIKGMRAPFLAVGGDRMFNMLSRYGFYYDSSMPTESPSWPYSLEYRMPHSLRQAVSIRVPPRHVGGSHE